MPETWTGRLVGKMHNAGVTQRELADELGCSRGYVTMVLNSYRKPAGAKERFEQAFQLIVGRKKYDRR